MKRPENVIFEAIVGSQAYGTAAKFGSKLLSDIDIKGVYIQPLSEILRGEYVPQVEVGKDTVYYELARFIDLLSSANPTVLELLYTPEKCIIEKNLLFDILIENRQMFLTKRCKDSFGGYAIQQINKAKGLDKKLNWEKEQIERKTPLDFCRLLVNGTKRSVSLKEYIKSKEGIQEYYGLNKIPGMADTNLYYIYRGFYKGICHDDSNTVLLSPVDEFATPFGIVSFDLNNYQIHCKKYQSYQEWLKNRNVARYVDIENHGQKIDGKNMMHCVRLLRMASEIVTDKTLNIDRSNKDAEYLLSIRKGKVDLDKLIAECEPMIKQMDKSFDESDLPNDIDLEKAKNILESIRMKFYNL